MYKVFTKYLQFPGSKELFKIVVTGVDVAVVVTDVVVGTVVVVVVVVSIVVVVVVARIEEVRHLEQHSIFILFVHHLLDDDVTTTNDG
jgi:hypothetical protein